MLNERKFVLFVARYPQNEALKEGMSQRMVAVDQQFSGDARIYLFASHRLFEKKEVYKCAPNALQYNCNLFVHFFLILKLLRQSQFIYFHSIQNLLPIFPCMFFLSRNKKIVLDIHGTVPEEHMLAGWPFKSKLYSIVEKYIFKRLTLAVTVTESMRKFYQLKYPSTKAKFETYSILPAHILNQSYSNSFQSDDEFVNVVYSGNLQAWQNLDLMLNVIANNIDEKIRYFILTGEPEKMAQLLALKEIEVGRHLILDSVSPENLKDYYAIAHYGFILRDDIVVNNVACPTKLIEYMFYGIIPVVKSVKIGDFNDLGFEYICVEDFNSKDLKPKKSDKNNKIISSLKDKSINFNIKNIIKDA